MFDIDTFFTWLRRIEDRLLDIADDLTLTITET